MSSICRRNKPSLSTSWVVPKRANCDIRELRHQTRPREGRGPGHAPNSTGLRIVERPEVADNASALARLEGLRPGKAGFEGLTRRRFLEGSLIERQRDELVTLHRRRS